MADMMEYKCPACGGAMEFDSKTQKMKCPYCDTEMEVEEFRKLSGEPEKQTDSESWEAAGSGEWKEGEAEGIRVYTCKSCGGEIIADETTGATTCPFCGNRVVMKEQFEGVRRPDYIIPFKLDKKAAKEAYHRHLEGKYFMPAIFKKENHIDEIKGVYVPYWVFDAGVQVNAVYDADRRRVWRVGDREYTECENYRVSRVGHMEFAHVPVDGSRKMDDTLMESVEPFRFSDAVPFDTAYLAGYVAERYDVDVDACMARAKSRIRNGAESALSGTVQGYHGIRKVQSSVHLTNAQYQYVLYPVWFLRTKWRGKQYVFAMNGQTGKMVGDLPFDKGEFQKYVVTRGIAIGAVFCALICGFLAL